MAQNPIQFMIENREAILSAPKEGGGSPSRLWDRLKAFIPEIEAAMAFNTFKQYVGAFLVMADELDKVTQRLHAAEQEVTSLRGYQSMEPAQSIDGWNVQLGKDHYFRLFKKVRGRVRSIYLGRIYDVDKARARIRAKEEELGMRQIADH